MFRPRSGKDAGTAGAVCFVFFLSGVAALTFETLWFRQATLALGSSIWASSLVLAGFMAGLALGNGLAARLGNRVRRPTRLYAWLEFTIAVSGLALVHLLPKLTPLLVPLLRPFQDMPWILNPIRLGAAFVLLLLPSTAMGVTLPLLVSALLRRYPSFGGVLGRLYGWNTLGAVFGALAGDAALIGWLGIRGTGLVAAGLGTTAAALALGLARRLDAGSASPWPTAGCAPVTRRALVLLVAAFLLGATLLALEVIWFRFLLLFVRGTSFAFATMLAIVLAGIGLGALAGGRWLSVTPRAERNLPVVALTTGAVCVLVYATLEGVIRPSGEMGPVRQAAALVVLGPASVWMEMVLMFPVAMLSGILFTLLGESIHAEVPEGTRAAGLLTCANTTGAALGPLVAGFVLLPSLGIEASLRLLAAGYGIAAVLLLVAQTRPARPPPPLLLAAGVAWIAAIGWFPTGLLRERFVQFSIEPFVRRDHEVLVDIREGLNETIIYTRRDRFGQPFYYRMLTNGHSMSATHWPARRYMELFVYWPVAVHPDPRQALLISYGVGATAKALTDTRSLETIDVVDISKDALEMSRIVYPDRDDYPLSDPRVNVHVEDGRHFLQTTRRRFDLITGEPPPPGLSGIVNLYTREFFELVRSRLAEGGFVTYWFPTGVLTESAARAVACAFCDVFEDCSLWGGSGTNWMLVGSNGASGPVSAEQFTRQWRDPVVAPKLRALGFELPEQLGALFVADGEDLRVWTDSAAPLVDDRPGRLYRGREAVGLSWGDVAMTRARFERSSTAARLWPESLRRASLDYFDFQELINRFLYSEQPPGVDWQSLHRILVDSSLETLALWQLRSGPLEVQLARAAQARGSSGLAIDYNLGAGALASRRYRRAAELFRRGLRRPHAMRELLHLEIFALCMDGRLEPARRLARLLDDHAAGDARLAEFIATTFGVKTPLGAGGEGRPGSLRGP